MFNISFCGCFGSCKFSCTIRKYLSMAVEEKISAQKEGQALERNHENKRLFWLCTQIKLEDFANGHEQIKRNNAEKKVYTCSTNENCDLHTNNLFLIKKNGILLSIK